MASMKVTSSPVHGVRRSRRSCWATVDVTPPSYLLGVEGEPAQSRCEYVVFDLETTGLGAGARVIEIACVVLASDGSVISEIESLVDAGGEVGPAWLHGITPSMVAEAPRFAQVASLVERTLQGRIHVAHNLAFDRRILRHEFGLLGVSYPLTHGGICTADLARRCLGAGELAEACEILGIDHTNPHRAMPDAVATADVFRALMLEAPVRRSCPAFPGAWRLPASVPLKPRGAVGYGPELTAVGVREGDR